MKKTKRHDPLPRALALALLLPTIAAAVLSSCRNVSGRPSSSLVVGVDELTDPPAETLPYTGEATDTSAPSTGDATNRPDKPTTKPVTEETTQQVDIVNYEYDTVTVDETIAVVGASKSRKILRYPKLTGLSNADMQTKINTLLGEIAASEFKNRTLGLDDYTKNGVAVRYEVAKTSVTYLGGNLLSVRSAGSITYSDGSEDVDFAYSNVINLSTGRNITQKKIYQKFGEIKALFENGRFTQISGAQNLTSSISLADMMSQYAMYELYNTYPDTYFTPKELVIIVELNTKLGGYAEFSIPLSDVNAYLSVSPTK